MALLWPVAASPPAAADTTDRFLGTVLFMRHALAPGFGDPDHFSVKDCTTQRNLDETGRAQARAIGAKLGGPPLWKVQCVVDMPLRRLLLVAPASLPIFQLHWEVDCWDYDE